MIRRFHDSLFAGHLGFSMTVFRFQTRVYWPGLRNDVRTYIASCTVCSSKKITMPVKGADGPHHRGPPLGESGHGLIRYVSHVGKKGKLLCAG